MLAIVLTLVSLLPCRAQDGSSLENQGRRLLSSKDYGGAAKAFQEAAKAYHTSGDAFREFGALRLAGGALQKVPDPGGARDVLTLAQTLARKLNNDLFQSQAEGGLGDVEFDQGNYPAAEAHFQAALKCLAKHPDPVQQRLLQFNLGACLQNQRRADQALRAYNEALKLSQGPDEQIEVLFRIGKLQLGQNNSKAALEAYTKAVDLAHKSGDAANEKNAWHNLSLVYDQMGDKVKAEEARVKAGGR